MDERDEIEKFLEMHKRLSKKLLESAAQFSSSPPPTNQSSKLPNSTSEILNAVGDVLNRHGRAMQLADLHDALTERGIVVPGKDPRNNLSAKLYASDRFATTRGVGWWFASSKLSETKGPADEGEALNGSGAATPDVGG